MPSPTRRRRGRALAITAGAVLLVVSLVVGFGVASYVRAAKSNLGELDFANELRIPPLDTGVVGADGVRRFELDIQAGQNAVPPRRADADVGGERRLPRPDAASGSR